MFLGASPSSLPQNCCSMAGEVQVRSRLHMQVVANMGTWLKTFPCTVIALHPLCLPLHPRHALPNSPPCLPPDSWRGQTSAKPKPEHREGDSPLKQRKPCGPQIHQASSREPTGHACCHNYSGKDKHININNFGGLSQNWVGGKSLFIWF